MLISRILWILLSVALLPCKTFAFATAAKQAFLIEESTSTVLFDKDADKPMTPSSMSKLMTIYIAFKNLKDGRIKLTDEYIVSKKAWSMGGSRMFLDVGKKVSIGDLIMGIVVDSGNDASVCIAESISGSEDEFVSEMNNTATKLGLLNSTFKNSSGWPENGHVMSPRDLVTLAQALIRDFPEYYDYFAKKEFTYNKIKQCNRNKMLGQNGIDGLKTGSTDTGGLGITISAQKNGTRLIGVVNGLNNAKEREEEALKLISFGFGNFEKVKILNSGSEIKRVRVWYGKERDAILTVAKDAEVFIKKNQDRNAIKVYLEYCSPIKAPISKGQALGNFVLRIGDNEIGRFQAVALKDINAASIIGKFSQNIAKLLF